MVEACPLLLPLTQGQEAQQKALDFQPIAGRCQRGPVGCPTDTHCLQGPVLLVLCPQGPVGAGGKQDFDLPLGLAPSYPGRLPAKRRLGSTQISRCDAQIVRGTIETSSSPEPGLS